METPFRPEALYPDDLERFPPLSEYLKNLEYLKKYDFSNHSIDQIEKIFFEKATILPNLFGLRQATNFRDPLYRVRLNINSNNEDLTLIRTYSYPPGSVCRSNGRANLKGRSVFYCSHDPITALLECKPENGNLAYLSVWQPRATRDIKYAMCMPKNLSTSNPWLEISNNVHAFSDLYSREHASEKSEHFKALYQFVADQFVNELEPYYITSWLSEKLLYGGLWRDFIFYPSFVRRSENFNLAFHPNSVEEHLRFEKVIKFKFLGIIEQKIRITDVEIGKPNLTSIEWNNDVESDLLQLGIIGD